MDKEQEQQRFLELSALFNKNCAIKHIMLLEQKIADYESSRIEPPVKPACVRCEWMETQLKKNIEYPTKAQGRRTKDGYPQEFFYDEFAYKRMVDSFRQGLKDILKDSKSV